MQWPYIQRYSFMDWNRTWRVVDTVQARPMCNHRDPSSEAGQGFVEEVRGLVKEKKVVMMVVRKLGTRT